MALYKLGKYIHQCELKNKNNIYNKNCVIGLSTKKEITTTKADLEGVDLTSYKLFPPQHFAYVSDTSRRGDKVSLAFNNNDNIYLVSSISTVFYVKNYENLLSDYLFLYFNRPEFDRYARYNSWGSARETFDWEDLCNIEIDLPPLPIQQKYVDIYKALVANQASYERGLEDLKLVCDGYIEDLRRKMPCEAIGKYIKLSDRRNDLNLSVDAVRGLAVTKEMISTKADMDGVSLSNYKIVPPGFIAYVSDTSRRGDKMSLGFNNSDETYLVSSISTVFEANTRYLLPEYLMLYFCRNEFDRYARFHSWGSARETFDWDEMCNIKIPIPSIEVQESIVSIYNAYIERKSINERLKAQIRDICPILIKGSIEEARKQC